MPTTTTESVSPALPNRGLAFSTSLRVKAMALLVFVAATPAIAVALLLAGANRDAIETSERQLQAAVLAEISGSASRVTNSITEDAQAIAAALSLAAAAPENAADGLSSVRALLSTRQAIDSVRFEIPGANFSTVLRRTDATTADAPSSTPELRSEADARGAAFAMTADGTGIVVVPIVSGSPTKARGYVTTRADLSRIETEMSRIAATRFSDSHVRLLVADNTRRAVAVHGVTGVRAGQDLAGLPIWAAMPEGATRVARVGVVTSHLEQGVPMLGALETLGELGWTVAMFRPEADAYRVLGVLRRRTAGIVLGVIIVALALGLVVGGAIARPVLKIARGARRIGQRRWSEVNIAVDRSDELGELSQCVQQMAVDLQSSEVEIASQARVRGDLSRYMSRDLVDAIVRGDHSLELGGRRAEISVLFADVVAFTPLAESRSAEEVVSLLNELFSMLTEIVFRHGGTVDKFIGDCIMAIWGAPVAQPDHAQRALAAAEDMMRFLESANVRFREVYGVEIRLGIGVNSGEAIVGNIGSDKRMEYTVIGDVVNVAARLESIAAPNQLLVSAATRRLAGVGFDLTLLGEKNLTGRKTTTTVYQLETEV